jgi:polyisoprenoid-binding protein YceI
MIPVLFPLTIAASLLHAQASQQKPSAVKSTPTLTLHLDPDQTKIDWTIGVTLHKVHGTFKSNGGELIADLKTGTAQGEVEIPTASLTTGDSKRDEKFQNDVLESAKYPAIIFHPTQIDGLKIDGLKAGDGEQTVKAIGTMTLRGSDHPVELTLHLQVSGKQATVTTHFVVPYVKWGLKDPSTFFARYDKEVAVDITAKGTLEQQVAVPGAPQAGDSK